MSKKHNIAPTITAAAAVLGIAAGHAGANKINSLIEGDQANTSKVAHVAPQAGRITLEKGMTITSQDLGVMPKANNANLGPSTKENLKKYQEQEAVNQTVESSMGAMATWPEKIKLFSEKHGMTFHKDYDVKPSGNKDGLKHHTILSQSPMGGDKVGYSFLIRYTDDTKTDERKINDLDLFSFDDKGDPFPDGLGGTSTMRALDGIELYTEETGDWNVGYIDRAKGLDTALSISGRVNTDEVRKQIAHFDDLLAAS